MPFVFDFAIDRGGTFTEVYCSYRDDDAKPGDSTKVEVLKLLSDDPANYADAPREGIRRIIAKVTGRDMPRSEPLDTSCIRSIRMGTTVATNALLERKGERCAFLVTKGFRHLLAIGNQSRPNIFDLAIRRPDVLYSAVEEIDERVAATGPICAPSCADSALQSLLQLDLDCDDDAFESNQVPDSKKAHDISPTVVVGVTGERVVVLRPPRMDVVRAQLARLLEMNITSIAVAFMHSFVYPVHERMVGEMALSMGFRQVSLSSDLVPMVKIVPRAASSVADAYLTPCIQKYVQGFGSGFDGGLAISSLSSSSSSSSSSQLTSHPQKKVPVLFMQSDGGLVPVSDFTGFKAILSGPAGGVVGYSITTWEAQDSSERYPVIGFDMGGTSTDVSRYAGRLEHVYETTTAGVSIQTPQLDINTVAAGGGSRLFFRTGLLVVGPESAGAHPGPICYRKNGYLAITDANLLLGRLLPEFFPSIFGPNEDQPLDREAVKAAFEKMAVEINAANSTSSGDSMLCESKSILSTDEVAYGFIKVANEAMCRPIRALTQAKGHDTSSHVLAVFGGAGGQHACAIARSLGMKKVFIHRYASMLSAYGLSMANVVREAQEPCSHIWGSAETLQYIQKRANGLSAIVRKKLQADGFDNTDIRTELYLNMRYHGTDCALMIAQANDIDMDIDDREMHDFERWNFKDQFLANYRREFGFTMPDRDIWIDDIRVRGIAGSQNHGDTKANAIKELMKELDIMNTADRVLPCAVADSYFEGGRRATVVYRLDDFLRAFDSLSSANIKSSKQLAFIDGPALLVDTNSTIVIEPDCRAKVSAKGDIWIDVGISAGSTTGNINEELDDAKRVQLLSDIVSKQPRISTSVDPVYLSIFAHRFMSIAELMGRTLRTTAISTNIKERLDFSCALFGPDGGLIANAPHIPVHLGAMQEAVRFQMRFLGDDIHEGDVLMSNHPAAGGSHLPDINIIMPVFDEGRIVFWVANRGHHADIGGISPGSMPPDSKYLYQEGAAVKSFKIVSRGVFNEQGVRDILMEPSNWPGCSGTRNIKDNLSDLRAQIAANNKGVSLVKELIAEYGLDVVHAYMGHIQANAEVAVRELLRNVARNRLHSEENHKHNGHVDDMAILHASDFLDDGTEIRLCISINAQSGDALFDFSGTGVEVLGNLNSPPAVTYSAVIYCLRSMLSHEVPLNQGCLQPVRIVIPKGSILNPSETAAVVGGNVLTSQRLTDVILKAFEVCAASQGCMNNLTFGNHEFGYYETIAGGSGAGPTWDGQSGVHTHMTNTRITDAEIMEKRYPVLVREFGIRKGSGGGGFHPGGDGVIRDLQFLTDLSVSMLSERRALRPYGMHGGDAGAAGCNLLITHDHRIVNIGGKSALNVKSKERLRIMTPGGGGYGSVSYQTHSNLEVTSSLHSNLKKRPRNEESLKHRHDGDGDILHRGIGGSLGEYARTQQQV